MSIDINTHPILVKTAINMLDQKLDNKLISSVPGLKFRGNIKTEKYKLTLWFMFFNTY